MEEKQLTKSKKFGVTVRGFFGKYRPGVDFWALGLFGLLLLPNIVWWFYSPENDVLRAKQADAMEIVSRVFELLAVLVLVFVVRKEREPSLSFRRLSFSDFCPSYSTMPRGSFTFLLM